jgi:hypothetical protein
MVDLAALTAANANRWARRRREREGHASHSAVVDLSRLGGIETLEGGLKLGSKKVETDARSALAGNLVREEDRRLKKIKTGGPTCKARFRSGLAAVPLASPEPASAKII